MAVHCKEDSRRSRRKRRHQLSVGDSNLSGVVVKWDLKKFCGFIQPKMIDGKRVARIWFSYWDVPQHREKCVGLGRQVYFKVAKGGNGKLKAIIL